MIWFLLFCLQSAFASNQILSYAPTIYDLQGVLDIQTFPGRPNYESIASGDEIERGFYLKLDVPIDLPHATKENPDEEYNVKVIHLVVEKDVLWEKLKKLGKGERIKVHGSLFHRFSGHHHSRILLSTESIGQDASAR